MQEQKRRTGAWLYGLAAAILVIGCLIAAVLIYTGINRVQELVTGLDETLPQFVVPGVHELTLSETGKYTIFYEYRSTVGGRVFSTSYALPNMLCRLLAGPRGIEIPLKSATLNSSYTFGGREGVSLFEFEIADPGVYTLDCRYPAGQQGPEVVFAVGHDIIGETVGAAAITAGSTLGGVFVLCGAAVLASIIALLAYLRGRSANKPSNATPF